MVNAFFELERLRDTLSMKGVDAQTVSYVVARARQDIQDAFDRHSSSALESAVAAGVEKRSPEFINELRLDAANFEVGTESGRMDFTTPPFPMLYSLLQNAKPMKDGSGVYKVIPIGKPGNRPPISTNIEDAQKRIMVERMEAAKKQFAAIAPAGSKQQFRTATSKQNPNTQWVQKPKDKNFGEELNQINQDLQNTLDDEIWAIIRGYEDQFL